MKNPAASVQTRLAQRRTKTGEDYNVLLVRFTLERLLYRLSISKHREQFVLKGAMLFALWEPEMHRVTRRARGAAASVVTGPSIGSGASGKKDRKNTSFLLSTHAERLGEWVATMICNWPAGPCRATAKLAGQRHVGWPVWSAGGRASPPSG